MKICLYNFPFSLLSHNRLWLICPVQKINQHQLKFSFQTLALRVFDLKIKNKIKGGGAGNRNSDHSRKVI